jgi:hypothetical protein
MNKKCNFCGWQDPVYEFFKDIYICKQCLEHSKKVFQFIIDNLLDVETNDIK